MAWMFDQVLRICNRKPSTPDLRSGVRYSAVRPLEVVCVCACTCALGQEEKPMQGVLEFRGTPKFIFQEESGDIRSRSPNAIAD